MKVKVVVEGKMCQIIPCEPQQTVQWLLEEAIKRFKKLNCDLDDEKKISFNDL